MVLVFSFSELQKEKGAGLVVRLSKPFRVGWWDFGIMGWWYSRMVGFWDIGMLGFWDNGTVGTVGMVGWWDGGGSEH